MTISVFNLIRFMIQECDLHEHAELCRESMEPNVPQEFYVLLRNSELDQGCQMVYYYDTTAHRSSLFCCMVTDIL